MRGARVGGVRGVRGHLVSVCEGRGYAGHGAHGNTGCKGYVGHTGVHWYIRVPGYVGDTGDAGRWEGTVRRVRTCAQRARGYARVCGYADTVGTRYADTAGTRIHPVRGYSRGAVRGYIRHAGTQGAWVRRVCGYAGTTGTWVRRVCRGRQACRVCRVRWGRRVRQHVGYHRLHSGSARAHARAHVWARTSRVGQSWIPTGSDG